MSVEKFLTPDPNDRREVLGPVLLDQYLSDPVGFEGDDSSLSRVGWKLLQQPQLSCSSFS